MTYLISRFLFMIAQTRVFPTISTMTSMERTEVMAIVAGSNMIDERQCYFRDLNNNKKKQGYMKP